MAIAHPLDIEYLIFRMKPKHHDVLYSGRAYHFLENLDRGHLISIRHGLGKPFQYFRIPFDVASRDKDAFSRHTPQQTFVRQRVNGVANRLPGRSILIRQLIFGGQRRTLFFFLPGAEILQRLGGVGRSLLHGLIDGQPLHNAVQEAGDIAVARAHAVHKVFTGNDAEFMELASVVAQTAMLA